jgi:nucleotide-binding universal stress UspA family protein
MMINRILVALDGSRLAEQALPAAAGLAEKGGAEIVLVTAIAPAERWSDAQTPGWEEEENVLARGYLDTTARPLRDNGAAVRVRVIWGHAGEMICQVAEEENADLVLMTTHGRSGIKRILIGSVADNVLRTIDRPLMLLHAQETTPETLNLHRILVPLDGSPLAETALPFVKRLAKGTSASIVLERVVVPPTFLYAEQYIPSTFPVLEDMEADAGDYLDEIKSGIEADGIKTLASVETGFPAETIVDAAGRFGVDLIALTTHGRTGAARTLLGSVADTVVRNATCPCLIIPARVTAARPHEEVLVPPLSLGIEPPATVIPPPAMREVPARQKPRVKATTIRQHRPEGPNRRKA